MMLDQSINKSLQGRWKDAEAGYRVALTYVEKVDIYGGLVGGSKKNESSNAPPPSPTEKLRSPDKHKQCLQCGKAGLVWGGVWGGGGRRGGGGGEVEGGSGRAGGWRGNDRQNGDWSDLFVPAHAIAVLAWQLPLLADLLSLCARGHRGPWGSEGCVDGDAANS